MLRIISVVGYVFGALFVLLLLLSLLRNTKKKSLKGRKKIINRRKVYGVAALFFLVIGIVLQVSTEQGEKNFKEFINDTSPEDVYQANNSYSSLPAEIFSAGDDYYIKNGKNQIFGYLDIGTVVETEEGKKVDSSSYESGLCYTDALQVAGGKDFLAVRSKSGVLTLMGAFEYLAYEKDASHFKGEKRAEKCTFLDANSNNLFYVENGTLYSAGYNAFGVLGDGTERNRLESSAILENVASVSVSPTHVLAVDIYGNLYGFGDNSYSEMGNRTTAQSPTPIKLMGGVKQAQAGKYFSVVLTKNGDVYTAGRNHLGQLGTEDYRDYATYMKVLEGVDKISVKGNSCAALTAGGTLYVWGDNAKHQLGISDQKVNKPIKVSTDVYDMAMGEASMGVILLNRNVAVTGVAREQEGNAYLRTIYELNAQVPVEYLYRPLVVLPARDGE